MNVPLKKGVGKNCLYPSLICFHHRYNVYEQGDTERWCKRVGKSGDKVCVTRQAWIRKR
jgi:hypothetical protein